MTMFTKKVSISTLLHTLGLLSISKLFVPLNVLAQITNPVVGDLGSDAAAAASGATFGRYFATLWNTAVTVGGFIVLIYFIWAAFEWITAGSDSSKLEKARGRILQSALGLLILVSSFTIVSFMSDLFFADQYSILKFNFTRPGL